jgi:TolA-binding protein
VIRSRDDVAQVTIDQASKQTAANMSSVMLSQTAIHKELALALGLGASLSYASSFLGPLVLTGVATLSTGALVLTYKHAVGQNNTQLNTSLPVVAQASTDMEQQLIEAHQRTILLSKYEELEKAQQKLKEEREEWQRVMREAEEAHEAMTHGILQRTIENSEQLASIRRNQAEASAVTSAEGGWLPSAVFKAAKAFVAYLARWIGASH